MEATEFQGILIKAVKGDKTAISRILEIYDPLICKNSYINGIFDDDLKQHISLHVVKKILEFKIVHN